ncbi:MAG: UbiA family prenyltransferase [Flavobacteriales bacterium]
MILFRVFLYLNGWIALAAGLQSWYWALYFSMSSPLLYGVLIFCGTLFIYNFHRFVKHRKQLPFESERQQWIRKHPIELITCMTIAGITSFILLIFKFPELLLCFLPITLVSAIYTLFRSGILIKPDQIHLNKTIIIAACWVYLCVFIPAKTGTGEFIALPLIHIFLLINATALIFDIRDMEQDTELNRSIPGIFGPKNSLILAYFSIFAAVVLGVVFQHYPLAMASIAVLVSGLLLFAFRKLFEKELLYTAGVDGLLIIHPLVLFAFTDF